MKYLYTGVLLLLLFSILYYIKLYYSLPEKLEEIKSNTITITPEVSGRPEVSGSKVIYWLINGNFNDNGIVDIIDNKAIIPIPGSNSGSSNPGSNSGSNSEKSTITSINYRVIDNNEKLSDIFVVNLVK